MTEMRAPKAAKWPFLLADLVLLGVAGLILQRGHYPLEMYELAGVVACAVAGAWCAVTPFLREYDATVRFAEAAGLATTVQQIQGLEAVAARVTSALNHLQAAQQQGDATVAAAQQIGERMTEEARNFAEFMQKANDTEKGHLRLEVEKLRRAEGDWIQVLVRMLDHTFALQHAAVRSRQPALIDQLNQFQFAQRDAARRVGLVAFGAEAGEVFDAAKHHPADNAQPPAGALIAEAVAPGYTFQGRVVRPAMVTLQGAAAAEPAPPAAPPAEPTLL